jgi:hypothetical protein
MQLGASPHEPGPRVRWVAAPSTSKRPLTRTERWETISDGFPLVLGCGVRALVVLIEAFAGVTTATAVQVALLVNVAVLIIVGWAMSPMTGLWRGVGSDMRVTGLLGVAMIGLTTPLHH